MNIWLLYISFFLLQRPHFLSFTGWCCNTLEVVKAFPKCHNSKNISLSSGWVALSESSPAQETRLIWGLSPTPLLQFKLPTSASTRDILASTSFQTLVYCQLNEAIIAFHSIYKRRTRPSVWVRHLMWQIEMARVWRRFKNDARNFCYEKEHIMSSAANRTSCAEADAF